MNKENQILYFVNRINLEYMKLFVVFLFNAELNV